MSGGVDRELYGELLNRTRGDARVWKGRWRAARWLRAKFLRSLRRSAPGRFGLDEARWRQFKRGEEPAFSEAEAALLDYLALAPGALRRYRAAAALGRREAAAWLWAALAERELRLTAERGGIPGATFWRFINARGYVTRSVGDRLAAAFGLAPSEKAALLEIMPHETFDNVDPLKKPARDGIKRRRMLITEFLQYSYISQDAWESFEPHGRGPVKQRTLLKLAVGLWLSPEEAWKFLGLVRSGFFMDCDIHVLAYMSLVLARDGRAEYCPEELATLLKERCIGPGGRRIFASPYPPEAELEPR